MIVRKRRPVKSRERAVERARPEGLDFPQIRKEVRLYNQVGIILKTSPVFKTGGEHKLNNF